MNGEILRKLRLEANLTQEQLGKKINVAPSTIRMIELGKRRGSDKVVKKIANFFNVSLDYLNSRDDLDYLINKDSLEHLNNKESKEEQEKGQLIDDFLDTLIEEGVITDPNNIDDKTVEVILNAVKAHLGYKMLKKSKGK